MIHNRQNLDHHQAWFTVPHYHKCDFQRFGGHGVEWFELIVRASEQLGAALTSPLS